MAEQPGGTGVIVPPPGGRKSDTERLHELGYAQELARKMGGFSNFAVSFTIISVLSGCLTLFYFGMNTGGPVVITLGWPLVGIMVTIVGLAMAEVASTYPTAGGLYYWSAKLAKRNAPAWSWFTGWFNLLGQIGITAGIDFGLSFFAQGLLHLLFGFSTSNGALMNDISVWWHILGVIIIVAVLLIVPDKHLGWGDTFTKFVNNTGFSFGGARIYVFLVGLLLAQYTFTGYDASAHMTEE